MSRLQANLALLLAAMIWGSAFVVQQVGTGGLEAITFTGARFLVGALIVLPAAVLQYRKVHPAIHRFTSKDWLLLTVTGAVLFLAAVIQQYGIFYTSVTNAGFLTALYIPLVPIIGFFILRRRMHWVVWPASLACFAGTYIMSGAKEINLQVGDLWVIASTIFWASHVLIIGYVATRTKAPLVVASYQFFVCGVLGLVLGPLVENPTLIDFKEGIGGIAYVGIMSVGFAFTLQVVGQRYTEAVDAAIILSSEAIFAALAGFILLGERLAPFQMSGALLIFCGILAVELIPMTRFGRPRPLD